MYLTFRNTNINIYFKEIQSNGNLTREEEVRLFTRIAKGDKSAETEVFNKMAKLAVAVAKTYGGKPELLEDLIQEANMGVLAAIRKYDVALGYRFSSYARWWMKAYITSFLNDLGVVHPCNNRIPDLVKKIRESFIKENHREISEYELLDKLEEMGEVINDVHSLSTILVTSIDQTVDDDDTASSDFGIFAEKTSSRNDFEDEMENQELTRKIDILMSGLSTREQELVRIYFGIGRDYECGNFTAVADTWNKGKNQYIIKDGKEKKNPEWLTAERCRQLVEGAIKKMKMK